MYRRMREQLYTGCVATGVILHLNVTEIQPEKWTSNRAEETEKTAEIWPAEGAVYMATEISLSFPIWSASSLHEILLQTHKNGIPLPFPFHFSFSWFLCFRSFIQICAFSAV